MIRRMGAPAPRAYADTRYKTPDKIKTALYYFACRAARHNYPRKRRRLPRNICACRFLLARKSRFRYNRYMKVFAISDLHLSGGVADKPMDVFGTGWQGYMEKIEADWRQKVSISDVVLLAGDLSWGMNMRQAAPDIARVAALPGKKVIIRGNHDYWWSSVSRVREKLPANTYALQNDAIKIGEYIFCGNRGWLIPEGKYDTEENQKLYNRELVRLELSMKSAKKLQTNNEKIIYITHYPPFNNKIEPSLYTKMLEEYGVSYVVFGHLHGYVNPKMLYNEINGIKYFFFRGNFFFEQSRINHLGFED